MKKYIRYSTAPKEEVVKVSLIKASKAGVFKDYKKSMMGIPQNIFSVAACSPDYCQIEMTDETIDMKVNYKTDADIVVVMFHTPSANRGYEIADKFRKLGKTVVLGGLHPTFMQEEALEHADALLVGEAEEIWEELLEDYKKDSLKKIYERTSMFDLSNLKPYPTDIIPVSKYDYTWSIVVSRGCVNKCSYCTVNKFFPSFRKRPIEDVIEEVKNCGTDFVELKSDNFMIDRQYALDLFKALEPLDIIWFTALEPSFADDKELVEAAAKSGLRNILLGIETPSRKSLSEAKKGHLDLDKLKSQIEYLHAFDIEIDSAMLFGFDDHDKTIFKETLEFVLEIGIDVTHGVVPIPFPGTDLFKKLKEEDRLTTLNWDLYDGSHLVFEHPVLTEKDVYYGTYQFEYEFMKRHKKREFKWHNRWYQGGVMSVGKPIKWKSILAIMMVLAGIYFEWNLIFGVLYVIWALLDIKTGHAYIIEDVTRKDYPILFWTIVSIWLFSGIWIVIGAL